MTQQQKRAWRGRWAAWLCLGAGLLGWLGVGPADAAAYAADSADTARRVTAAAPGFDAARGPLLVWQPPDGALSRWPAQDQPLPAVPLGSVWKLFVHAYLTAQGANEPPYRCATTERRSDEDYCCEPGGSIDRDTALVRSCGAYFAPQRLGLRGEDWRGFWRTRNAPDWLLDLAALQPGRPVPLGSLLDALQRVPDPARLAARAALLPNSTSEPAVLQALGSAPRFKTWSWFDARQQRIGGGAGWLADGTAFWFGAPGTGRSVARRHATTLAQAWAAQGRLSRAPDAATQQAEPCVAVRFFARYPLASIRRDDGQPVADGPLLPGRYTLRFANGQTLALPGQGVLRLSHAAAGPQLSARLPLEDYVARVLDREGDAGATEAARALAITARSWLLQNAPIERGGCHAVADSSQAQRVSPRPPGATAREVANFTAGLVLEGAPVRYHLDQRANGVLVWRDALAAAQAGQDFETILRSAFPDATLTGWGQPADCQPLPDASRWLAERQPRWRARLRAQAGYEPLDQPLQVCQLQQGLPHADQRRLRIHLREWFSREGRVTLIHEYLHLAFRHHPNGQDEVFIEQLAQQLADS